MTETQPARSLDIEIHETVPDKVTVLLKANSSQTQKVSYELETSGSSKTRHKGSTVLTANKPAVLSTIKFSKSADWCVTLKVSEEAGESYQIVKGSDCS